MALLQFGTPIVPVSLVGSFEIQQKTSYWLIRRGKITVYLHDTIETKDPCTSRIFPLSRDRVHAIISRAIDEIGKARRN